MFKVQFGNNKEMKVTFRHFNPVARPELISFGTCCFIEIADKSDAPYVAMGKTKLHPLDYQSYDKERGRKLALARALEDYGLNKEGRTAYWRAYFEAKEEARQRAKNDAN